MTSTLLPLYSMSDFLKLHTGDSAQEAADPHAATKARFAELTKNLDAAVQAKDQNQIDQCTLLLETFYGRLTTDEQDAIRETIKAQNIGKVIEDERSKIVELGVRGAHLGVDAGVGALKLTAKAAPTVVQATTAGILGSLVGLFKGGVAAYRFAKSA